MRISAMSIVDLVLRRLVAPSWEREKEEVLLMVGKG